MLFLFLFFKIRQETAKLSCLTPLVSQLGISVVAGERWGVAAMSEIAPIGLKMKICCYFIISGSFLS